MKSSTLSILVTEGVLNKKDRILCYQDRDRVNLGWLRRQHCKVEGPLPDSQENTGGSQRPVLFDIVLVEQESAVINEAATHFIFLREALRYVRPGGRLLICYSGDSLFDSTDPETLLHQLKQGLSKESIASIAPTLDPGLLSERIFTVKRGGAYKPRLPVKYIEDPQQFAETCQRLASESCIGLDVETTLKEPRILCTVQMATESVIYIIDALPLKDLKPLKALMEDASVMKIIHNKDFEAAVLGQYGIKINHVYDTLVEARRRHKKKGGGGNRLGEVCERELGIYLDKSWQASDWTKRPLSAEQMDYAAADAEVMIRLYRIFVPPQPPATMELF